jgi:thymidylate kinase
MWIILDVPPHLPQEGQRDVSYEESARRREAYLGLARELPHAIVVDASRPLPAVVSQVNHALLDFMARRVRNRLRFALYDA